jgi:adenine-specific DNA-methyltransferase
LIYPRHFSQGWIDWRRPHAKKADAFAVAERSAKWLVPGGVYVLVKRFSPKEETHRIVAAIYDPARVPARQVAFENHVNYFHLRGGGLPMPLAKGLTAFLNSTRVDEYFRQFNGHTQVNAADLRSLPYPHREQMEELGDKIGANFPAPIDLDRLVEKELWLRKSSNSSAASSRRAGPSCTWATFPGKPKSGPPTHPPT